MRYLLPLAALLLVAGCSVFGDEDPLYIYGLAYTTHVEVAAVQDRTVVFDYSGRVADSCWEFVEVDVDYPSARRVEVGLRYRRDQFAVCPPVVQPVEREVRVEVPSSGTYTFHFPAPPDAGVNVEVTVP